MKTYFAKPKVETKEYQDVKDVLPLLAADTHKVKVRNKSGIFKRVTLKYTACIVDGKVVDVGVAKEKTITSKLAKNVLQTPLSLCKNLYSLLVKIDKHVPVPLLIVALFSLAVFLVTAAPVCSLLLLASTIFIIFSYTMRNKHL